MIAVVMNVRLEPFALMPADDLSDLIIGVILGEGRVVTNGLAADLLWRRMAKDRPRRGRLIPN